MIEEPVTSRELRVFGLGAGAILLALPTAGMLLRPREHYPLAIPVGLALGALLMTMGAFFPRALAPVYGKWMVLARAIARFNTIVLLTATYCLVLVPLGLLLRLVRTDPMDRQMEKGSYWRRPRSHSLGNKHFERQF